jgi:hypothetical protein
MRRCTWAVVLLGLLGPGCGKKFVTVQLTPSKVLSTYDNNHHDEEDFACGPCGITAIVGCGDFNMPLEPDSKPVMVGYHNVFNAGTQPCDCWAWRSCAFRGYMMFDFATLPTPDVFSATLKWNAKTEKNVGGTAASDPPCIQDLYVAQAPWGPYKIPGDSLVIVDKLSPVDVGHQVRQWVKGQVPNYGFFVVGPSEAFASKSKDQCVTQLSNIKLDVTVTVPK